MHDLLRLFAVEQLEREPKEKREDLQTRLLFASLQYTGLWTASLEPSDGTAEGDDLLPPKLAEAWLEIERSALVALAWLAAKEGPRPVAWALAETLYDFLKQR